MSHRVILITGASAGIGRSCAITLSKAFPTEEHSQPLVLFLVGRREEELKKTGDACKEGTIIEIQTGDMGKEEDVERIFSVVKEKYGRLDLLFNVSCSQRKVAGTDGRMPVSTFYETRPLKRMIWSSSDRFWKPISWLLSWYVSSHNPRRRADEQCTKQAFILMKSQSPKGGRIVNNGSISVDSPRPSMHTPFRFDQ
jgi:NAD(P)-dependent dehydrogenase (short-subunit alcohol dehydrogenase family)